MCWTLTEEGSSESQSEEAADYKQGAKHHESYAGVENLCPLHHLPPGLGLHRHRHTAGTKKLQNAFMSSHLFEYDDHIHKQQQPKRAGLSIIYHNIAIKCL